MTKENRGTNWTVLILASILCLTAGIAFGWALNDLASPKDEVTEVTPNYLCGDTAEAKASRNLAWSAMNQELGIAPTTPEADAGKVLQYMMRTDSSDNLRVKMFSRFMEKSVIQFQSETEFNAWKMSFLLGDDAARQDAVTQLLEGDQAYAQIMQCLMKDTDRMKKAIAGEQIPLEE